MTSVTCISWNISSSMSIEGGYSFFQTSHLFNYLLSLKLVWHLFKCWWYVLLKDEPRKLKSVNEKETNTLQMFLQFFLQVLHLQSYFLSDCIISDIIQIIVYRFQKNADCPGDLPNVDFFYKCVYYKIIAWPEWRTSETVVSDWDVRYPYLL